MIVRRGTQCDGHPWYGAHPLYPLNRTLANSIAPITSSSRVKEIERCRSFPGTDNLDRPAGYEQKLRGDYIARDYHKPSGDVKADRRRSTHLSGRP